MAFRNSVVGGTTLVRPAIQSPNYVAGSTGWTIKADGTAEFNNATIRGQLSVGGVAPNPRIEIVTGANIPAELQTFYSNAVAAVIIFYGNVATTYHYYCVLNGTAGTRRGDVSSGTVREIELNVPGTIFQFEVDTRFTAPLFADGYIEAANGIYADNYSIGTNLTSRQIPWGILAARVSTNSNGTATSGTTETRDAVLGNYTFRVPGGSNPLLIAHYDQLVGSGTVAGDRYAIRLFMVAGTGTPTNTDTNIAEAQWVCNIINAPGRYSVNTIHTPFTIPGAAEGDQYTVAAFAVRVSGTGAFTPISGATGRFMYVSHYGTSV